MLIEPPSLQRGTTTSRCTRTTPLRRRATSSPRSSRSPWPPPSSSSSAPASSPCRRFRLAENQDLLLGSSLKLHHNPQRNCACCATPESEYDAHTTLAAASSAAGSPATSEDRRRRRRRRRDRDRSRYGIHILFRTLTENKSQNRNL